jgi:DNA invertase Pin-like site-specific DNA recombinase
MSKARSEQCLDCLEKRQASTPNGESPQRPGSRGMSRVIATYVRAKAEARLERQVTTLRLFARKMGLVVPVHFHDIGQPGPGLADLLDAGQRGELDAVLITDFRRLAETWRDYDRVLRALRQAGVWIISVNDGLEIAPDEDEQERRKALAVIEAWEKGSEKPSGLDSGG